MNEYFLTKKQVTILFEVGPLNTPLSIFVAFSGMAVIVALLTYGMFFGGQFSSNEIYLYFGIPFAVSMFGPILIHEFTKDPSKDNNS